MAIEVEPLGKYEPTPSLESLQNSVKEVLEERESSAKKTQNIMASVAEFIQGHLAALKQHLAAEGHLDRAGEVEIDELAQKWDELYKLHRTDPDQD